MSQSLKALAPSSSGAAVTGPESVSFDGATDYMSRSSDFVGNVESKTFTSSCWVYLTESALGQMIFKTTTTSTLAYFLLRLDSTRQLAMLAYDNSSLLLNITTGVVPMNQWINIQMSFDMANSANHSVYVGDTKLTTSVTTYNDVPIPFQSEVITISASETGAELNKGRLAHLFLAYDYLDLSVESNRRIFITADGKPT